MDGGELVIGRPSWLSRYYPHTPREYYRETPKGYYRKRQGGRYWTISISPLSMPA